MAGSTPDGARPLSDDRLFIADDAAEASIGQTSPCLLASTAASARLETFSFL